MKPCLVTLCATGMFYLSVNAQVDFYRTFEHASHSTYFNQLEVSDAGYIAFKTDTGSVAFCNKQGFVMWNKSFDSLKTITHLSFNEKSELLISGNNWQYTNFHYVHQAYTVLIDSMGNTKPSNGFSANPPYYNGNECWSYFTAQDSALLHVFYTGQNAENTLVKKIALTGGSSWEYTLTGQYIPYFDKQSGRLALANGGSDIHVLVFTTQGQLLVDQHYAHPSLQPLSVGAISIDVATQEMYVSTFDNFHFIVKLHPNGNLMWCKSGPASMGGNDWLVDGNRVLYTFMDTWNTKKMVELDTAGNYTQSGTFATDHEGHYTGSDILEKHNGKFYFGCSNHLQPGGKAFYGKITDPFTDICDMLISSTVFSNQSLAVTAGSLVPTVSLQNQLIYVPGTINAPLNVSGYCGFSDVTEMEIQTALEVFPNPAHGFITIQSKVEEDWSASLHDMTGKTLITTQFYKTSTVNIEMLPAGIYLLETRSKEGLRQAFKIVKE